MTSLGTEGVKKAIAQFYFADGAYSGFFRCFLHNSSFQVNNIPDVVKIRVDINIVIRIFQDFAGLR